MKVVVIGGGWAGCSAAIAAKKAGAQVAIYEKTDMLIGLGNVGGIMRNNGRYTAAEELIQLGAGELIHITDANTRHKNIDFPGHQHAWLYDVTRVEPDVRNYIKSIGVEIHLIARVSDVETDGNIIKGLYLGDGSYVEGDVFIETTGSTGPMGNCSRYGNGCAMCILRCPSFGPRVSVSARAGVDDLQGEREDGIAGAFSGSCELAKESLSEELVEILNTKGVVVLSIPPEDIDPDKLKLKVCQQYALKEFAENIVLLDTGHVKLMTPYYPVEKLRKIPGLERARFVDPYAGGKGNSIRYLSVAPRTDQMKVKGLNNLFCAGEKSGLFVGHTEAMCTGALAGHNAVRALLNMPLLTLPKATVIGDIISYANFTLMTTEGKRIRHTFAGSQYFKRMKELGLYSVDNDEIHNRIERLNLLNILNEKLI